jgi:hypothetical protein
VGGCNRFQIAGSYGDIDFGIPDFIPVGFSTRQYNSMQHSDGDNEYVWIKSLLRSH